MSVYQGRRKGMREEGRDKVGGWDQHHVSFFQESDSMQSLKLKTQFDTKLDTTEKINFLDKSEHIDFKKKKGKGYEIMGNI